MRDPTGALKRQAQRFRVYGYNAERQVVAELTTANAAIEWTVHVANKKAACYNFTLARDTAYRNHGLIRGASWATLD